MNQHTVFMPLAQLNTSVGGPGTSAAAPVVERATGAATTGGAAGGAAGGATSTSISGTAPATGPGGDAGKQPPSGSIFSSIIPIILMFGVLYLFLFRGQRKQERKRKDMINEMKKGDRVMTIGGMIARVVSIEGDEVVLKIDESANVKATYSKKSIQEVLDRDEKK
jgi:preprotein translocase subunit YajC